MIFAGTIEDNLLYGLKYRPQRPRPVGEDALSRYEREMLEAQPVRQQPPRSAGGLDRLCWPPGIEEPEQRVTSLVQRARAGAAGRRRVRPRPAQRHPRLAPTPSSRSGCSRRGGRCRSGWAPAPTCRGWSSRSIPDRYNTNASLAENLLFGSPVGPTFDPEQIADQPYVARDAGAPPVCSTTSTRSASGSPRPCSSCSPTCRPTTSISASSASSRPRICRPTAAC